MYVPQLNETVQEVPLFSPDNPTDLASLALLALGVFFLLVEQNLVLFALAFLILAFLYHPHQLQIHGRYASSDTII